MRPPRSLCGKKFSSVFPSTGLREGIGDPNSLPSAFLDDLGPGVAQGDGAVEHGGAGFGIGEIDVEISHAHELVIIARDGFRQAGLEAAIV